MSFGKGRDAVDEDAYLKLAPGYVEEMYAAKANLRPIHDALIELGRSLGPDVKVCPCQTIVPLYRNPRYRPGQADDQDADRPRASPSATPKRPAG